MSNEKSERSIIDEWEEEILMEHSRSKTIEDMTGDLIELYQHYSKFIIDPSKASTSWSTAINSRYDDARYSLNSVNGAKPENILRELNKKKPEIIKKGGKAAIKELKHGGIDEDLFYNGEVPDSFDILTMFDDKNKFIDHIQDMARKQGEKDPRRSMAYQNAINMLNDYKE